MEERDLNLENAVLNKAIQQVIRQAKQFTELTEDQIQNNYEEAIKISKIHSILQLKDFIDEFQETAHIAEAGILEAMAVEEHNNKLMERINIHSNLVDMNNAMAEILQDLVIDIIGEDKMQDIAMEVQLQDIL